MSLIYSMLGEVRSFSATPAVADRRSSWDLDTFVRCQAHVFHI